ncbi:LPXTG cell wall anchor domain-containing protein [Fructilactobacillus fructivorans]|uniref:LPXTG cell wall anchor domain-containing protein n=1 Tax=Fructilactobacillus fructivorans TaxID=1614 RepID=A0AAE6NZ17_9LACO|nr:LPXTG cell wall anchor domain-containing protein [Fructilactobacillus fructivorans]RDV65158.1 LPXTG cell wall anchor domain-containing protein [Fructilactobacillus fructivorans]
MVKCSFINQSISQTTNNTRKQSKLPQTGQNSNNILSTIGAALLSLLGFLVLGKWFKDQRNK